MLVGPDQRLPAPVPPRPVDGQPALTLAQASARAHGIVAVLADNDGTLTDGTCLYTADGELAKRYSMRDGMGFELLRLAGLSVMIVTREPAPLVVKRAEKLGARLVAGVHDKLRALPDLAAAAGPGATPARLAYIGDDINDIDIMREIARAGGLTAVPADGHPAVARVAHFIAPHAGGSGAFRAFAEWLLALRVCGDAP